MDIKRADIQRFHSRLAKKAGTANHCVSILSKLMSWAETQGYRAERSNPCFALKKFRENVPQQTPRGTRRRRADCRDRDLIAALARYQRKKRA